VHRKRYQTSEWWEEGWACSTSKGGWRARGCKLTGSFDALYVYVEWPSIRCRYSQHRILHKRYCHILMLFLFLIRGIFCVSRYPYCSSAAVASADGQKCPMHLPIGITTQCSLIFWMTWITASSVLGCESRTPRQVHHLRHMPRECSRIQKLGICPAVNLRHSTSSFSRLTAWHCHKNLLKHPTSM